jgi:RNA polymerase sigma-70 factor (ECF subfamily)
LPACRASSVRPFFGKIPASAETFFTVMTQPESTVGPDRPAGTVKIDWQAALAEHDRWLRTVVLARAGEVQAVDEIMQEVSLAAVRQSAPLADAAKVAPWLYRLAVTQALLYRRRQGRRRKLTDAYAQRMRPTEQSPASPTRSAG